MLDEAMQQFQRALRINSNIAAIHNSMGLIFFKKHKLEKATEYFQTAVALNPQFAQAHVNLGRTNLDGALDQYFIAIKIKPKLGAAHYNIACIYSLRDQKMLARESLKRAVGLNKKFARMARTDRDFLNISNSEEFQDTIKSDN